MLTMPRMTAILARIRGWASSSSPSSPSSSSPDSAAWQAEAPTPAVDSRTWTRAGWLAHSGDNGVGYFDYHFVLEGANKVETIAVARETFEALGHDKTRELLEAEMNKIELMVNWLDGTPRYAARP